MKNPETEPSDLAEEPKELLAEEIKGGAATTLSNDNGDSTADQTGTIKFYDSTPESPYHIEIPRAFNIPGFKWDKPWTDETE